MQLQTVVKIDKELNINYNSKILMFGSCFSEHIGNRLQFLKFSVENNPLGILFNPFSISQTIQRIIQNNPFSETDLFEHEGVWNSFSLHSEFADLSPKQFLENANQRLIETHCFLRDCDYLFITLGTAWIYRRIETGEIVANCHKVPASFFKRSRESVTNIVSVLSNMVTQLKAFNSDLQIVFTVSPIRHWRDGAHDNQISKSSLLLSIEEIQEQWSNIHYFPAFEIMMDELRDYRFYAEDMIHPNNLAINYIWEKFCEFSFDDKVKTDISEIEKVARSVAHKPLNPESPSHKKFKANTLQQIEQLQKKFPAINFQREREQLL